MPEGDISKFNRRGEGNGSISSPLCGIGGGFPTRRQVIGGIAAMLASQSAPVIMRKSAMAMHSIAMGGGAPLPYDAEVEYLESTGAQYIDTGIVAKSTTSMEMSLQVVQYNDGCTGSFYSGGLYYINFWGNKPYYRYGDTFFPASQGEPGWNVSGRNNIQFANGTIIHNGVVVASGIDVSGLGNNDKSFCLFAYNTNNGVRGFSYLKIFSFKITDGNNTICDMIPVRVGTTGYMYDRVSGQLFGNQGTGDFVIGRDINPISAKSYVQDGLVFIGENITPPSSDIQSVDIGVGMGLNDWTIEWCGTHAQTPRAGIFVNPSGRQDRTISFGFGWWINGNNTDINSRVYYSEVNSGQQSGVVVQFACSLSNGNTVVFYKFGTAFDTNNSSIVTSAVSQMANISQTWQYINCADTDYVDFNVLRIYSRALTAAEVAANYAVDAQRFNLP